MILEEACRVLGVPFGCMKGFLPLHPTPSRAQQAVWCVVRARKHGFAINLRHILQIFHISYQTYLKTRHSLQLKIDSDPSLSVPAFRQSLLRIFLHCKARIVVDPWINRLCADSIHSW